MCIRCHLLFGISKLIHRLNVYLFAYCILKVTYQDLYSVLIDKNKNGIDSVIPGGEITSTTRVWTVKKSEIMLDASDHFH